MSDVHDSGPSSAHVDGGHSSSADILRSIEKWLEAGIAESDVLGIVSQDDGVDGVGAHCEAGCSVCGRENAL